MKSLIIQTSVAVMVTAMVADVSAAPVTLPTSGTTAYVQCRTAGNFGSGSDTTAPPSTDSACVATNGVNTTLAPTASPESGYVLQSSFTSAITAFGESLATLNEVVFKSGNSCIYTKQLTMTSNTTYDYNNLLTGIQRMEVNDFVFGGYVGAVDAFYSKTISVFSSVYRIGRTYTSIQMQADPITPVTSIAPGFLILPVAGGASGIEINGVGQTAYPGTVAPTTAQQQAAFSTSWVNFTVATTGGVNSYGVSKPASPNMYIRQACTTSTTNVVANSMKIRQTGRETQPWIVITASSRAPSSIITP